MTETPETDQKASPHIGFYSCATVPAEFARKLERERDEAMKELMEWRPLCLWGGTPEYIHQFIKGQQARIQQTQNIEAQLKEARESCEMWINSLREAREKIERQAERIRKLEGSTNHASGTPLTRALRERDEARNTVEQLTKHGLDLMDANRTLKSKLKRLKENIK